MPKPAQHMSAADTGCNCLTCNLIRSGNNSLLRGEFKPNRKDRRALEAQSRTYPVNLVQIPKGDWPPSSLPEDKRPSEAWRSREFLVSVYYKENGVERLSVNRTSHNGESWEEGISWDDLQRLKSECGRGDRDAVEIYPADKDLVNVANMRHIFVLPEPFHLTWRGKKS